MDSRVALSLRLSSTEPRHSHRRRLAAPDRFLTPTIVPPFLPARTINASLQKWLGTWVADVFVSAGNGTAGAKCPSGLHNYRVPTVLCLLGAVSARAELTYPRQRGADSCYSNESACHEPRHCCGFTALLHGNPTSGSGQAIRVLWTPLANPPQDSKKSTRCFTCLFSDKNNSGENP